MKGWTERNIETKRAQVEEVAKQKREALEQQADALGVPPPPEDDPWKFEELSAAKTRKESTVWRVVANNVVSRSRATTPGKQGTAIAEWHPGDIVEIINYNKDKWVQIRHRSEDTKRCMGGVSWALAQTWDGFKYRDLLQMQEGWAAVQCMKDWADADKPVERVVRVRKVEPEPELENPFERRKLTDAELQYYKGFERYQVLQRLEAAGKLVRDAEAGLHMTDEDMAKRAAEMGVDMSQISINDGQVEISELTYDEVSKEDYQAGPIQMVPGRPLPGWTEHKCKRSGRYYYYHKNEKKTMWDKEAFRNGIIDRIKGTDVKAKVTHTDVVF